MKAWRVEDPVLRGHAHVYKDFRDIMDITYDKIHHNHIDIDRIY